MNATSHFELLKLKSAEQKKKTEQKPSTNSSAGLRLAEQITSVKQNQFLPKTGKPRMQAIWSKERAEEKARPKDPSIALANTISKMEGVYKGEPSIYVRPGSLSYKEIPSRGQK